MFEFDTDEYIKIKKDFIALADDDFVSAWGIAARVTFVIDYYMTKQAEFENIMEEYELEANAKREYISLNHDSKSVANGKRFATQSEEVIKLEQTMLQAKFQAQRLKSIVRTLDNIHFLCKSCYELGNRKYRNTGG